MSPTTSTSPHISVVIPTMDRPHMIERAVSSVLASEYCAFDLTVVDQSTTPATENILRPLAERDPRLRYIHRTQPGLSAARNMGVDRSRGDLLAFTDDDCMVPKQWLQTIVQAFSDRTVDLLYGQVFAPDSAGIQGVTPALRIPRQQRINRQEGFKVYGMGANFAARRSLFTAIGGFDEVMGAGGPLRAAEDFDFEYRTYRAGRTILLCPEVQVIHYGTRTALQWQATLRSYGIGDGSFYGKHIRCRDLLALRLLLARLVDQSARTLGRRVLRRGRGDLTYVRSIVIGVRVGLCFQVDRSTRLYVPRDLPMSGHGIGDQ